MKTIYALIGLIFFSIEILVYEWSDRLGAFWYAHKAGLGKLGDLCKNSDVAGNCLDFKWHTLVGGVGLFGIKIIVLLLFFIILFKKKKISPALLIALPYSLLILGFHFDLIPIKRLHELFQWLELTNIGGILAAGILVLVSLLTSIIYFYNKKNKTTANTA